MCALAEVQAKQLVLSRLDPEEGRGSEIARVSLGPGQINMTWAWALSFDSTKIAIVDRSAQARMLYVADARVVSLPVRGEKWGQLQTVGLSADGSLIFATAWSDGSNALISIDSLGNPQVLEQVHGSQAWLCCPVPSPNGRFLAFEKRTYENNVVMLENF